MRGKKVPEANPQQTARYDAIAAWATEMAGTELDLDPYLEAAAIEHLINPDAPERH